MGIEEQMQQGRRAGRAGLVIVVATLIAVAATGRCSPPDGAVPSPSPSAVRSR